MSDPNFSGTTCCTILMNGNKIISANCGDSRAIIVGKNNRIKVLSRDHKPDDADERSRITFNGGRIEAFRDCFSGEEMGPKRVWL